MAGNGISTVMMKGIFEDLAEGHQLPKKLGQELLLSMVERVTQHLRQGDRIRIGGLGTLEVRKREARTGRNPVKPWIPGPGVAQARNPAGSSRLASASGTARNACRYPAYFRSGQLRTQGKVASRPVCASTVQLAETRCAGRRVL